MPPSLKIIAIPLLAAMFVLGICGSGAAHDLGLAQVTVSASDKADEVILQSRLSATVDAKTPHAAEPCSQRTRPLPAPDRFNQRLETRLSCPGGFSGNTVVLPWKIDGVFLVWQRPDMPSETRFIASGPKGVSIALGELTDKDRSMTGVAGLYVVLGIEHILKGLDHLALLVCLAMLSSGLVLLRLVTAFTIGHSITLCIAAMDLVRIPSQPVEVLIVLSVAWLARDAYLGRRLGRDSTVLLITIGLLHGLGFASVLRDIGLPETDMLIALLSFNIGVELGQLMFFALLFAILWLVLRMASKRLGRSLKPSLAFGLGVLAIHWAADRVVGFYI